MLRNSNKGKYHFHNTLKPTRSLKMSGRHNRAELSTFGRLLLQIAYISVTTVRLDIPLVEDIQSNFENVPIAPTSMDSVPKPPLLPEYPYMLNRNNYDLNEGITYEQFYPRLTATLCENRIYFEHTDNFVLRCIAYPNNERIDFHISAYRRPINGTIVIEFHRYNGNGLLYYPLLCKIKVALNLQAEGEVIQSLQMPNFEDDLNLEYVPSNEEIKRIMDMIKDRDTCHEGLERAESMIWIPGARNSLLEHNIVKKVTDMLYCSNDNDIEVRRLIFILFRVIASSKETVINIDIIAVGAILNYMKCPTWIKDTLPYQEVTYQAVMAVEAILVNAPSFIKVELINLGLNKEITSILKSDWKCIKDVAQNVIQRICIDVR